MDHGDVLLRSRLHQSVQARIKEFIIEQGYQAGDALPTETELARSLGVSRGSLREAVKSLQSLGVVETRHGFGTFVGAFSFEPLIDGLTFQILISRDTMPRAIEELLELRQVLETGLMPRVVTEATPAQLAALDDIVSAMTAAANAGDQFADEDRRFHEALYAPIGNELILQLLRAFWTVFHAVGEESSRMTVLLQETAEQHRRIVDAVRERRTSEAAAAMSEHFAGALSWVPLLSSQSGGARVAAPPAAGALVSQ